MASGIPALESARKLNPPDRETAQRLRAFLQESNYDLETLRGELGLTDLASFRYRKVLYEHKTDLRTIDLLVQWFTCGMPVAQADAVRMCPSWLIEVLLETGLVYRDGGSLMPSAMLTPFNGMLIASDLVTKLEGDASDLIVWPNATTHQALNSSIPLHSGSMLDLGCGTGVLALASAAENSVSVTATDLNPRAAEFTAFNAALNGVSGVQTLTGDCYEPVKGRTFDRILCNPPFFLTPSTGLLYCENPMDLDLFARHLMRGAPAHLNESGFFQMLCEWVELEGQPWRERLQEWSDGIGCDVWALKTYTMTPAAYGKERCEQRPGTRAEADAAFARWLRYSDEKKVRAVHGGLVNVRRRSGSNWTRLDEDPTVTLAHPIGELILSRFDSEDLLRSSDEELLSARLVLVERARLRQMFHRQGSQWARAGLVLAAPGPFGREMEMDPMVADFVGQFDGTRTVSELVGALAQKVDAGPARVAKECVEVVRRLLDRGLLTRAEASPKVDTPRAGTALEI